MKGATALPCVSTMRPPKTVMSNRIGKSQNFFLILKNAHNSFKKLIYCILKLVLNRFLRWSGRIPLHPVGICLGIPFQIQQILAEEPHHNACR